MDFSVVLDLIDQFSWQATMFFVVLATLMARFGMRLVLNRAATLLEKRPTSLPGELLEALRRPLGWAVWIYGLLAACDVPRLSGAVGMDDAPGIFAFLGVFRHLAAIALFAWAAMRCVDVFGRYTIRKKREAGKSEEAIQEETFTVIALNKILRASILITTFLVILDTLGVSVQAVLAFGGVGGIAVGFAARDMLANFFGTAMLSLDKPFTVGDWILSHDREIEGTVEHVGWRMTVVRTFDKRPLYIPNSTFSTMIVENPSRMLNRRIYETFGVRYKDVSILPRILEGVRTMLREHKAIDQKQLTMVFLNELSPSSVDFFVYTFTKTTDWKEFHAIKEDVLFLISKIVQEHGGELAFPTQTHHLASLPQELLAGFPAPTRRAQPQATEETPR